MPSPLGHILFGAGVCLGATRNQDRRWTIWGVALLSSIAPDFDFLPGILVGVPGAFHHGASHSLFFAILCGAVIWLLARISAPDEKAARTAMVAGLAYGSHVILDLVSVSSGRGLPLLWPLSDERFGFDLGVFGHFKHSGLKNGIWSIIRWDNVPALTRELFVSGVLLLLVLWIRRRCEQSRSSALKLATGGRRVTNHNTRERS
jgi:hypothetical protein